MYKRKHGTGVLVRVPPSFVLRANKCILSRAFLRGQADMLGLSNNWTSQTNRAETSSRWELLFLLPHRLSSSKKSPHPFWLFPQRERKFMQSCGTWIWGVRVKSVLNWANVWTYFGHFDELWFVSYLVRRTWFGQFEEFTCSQLACNEMQTSPELAALTRIRQHDRKCRLKSSQYTLIIPHRVIQLTTISFWISETRLRLPRRT